jgi:para-nitrobenzyl esterase
MVWIYGLAYRFGTSGEDLYDGAALARGGVVVVMANHRVGVEGYAQLDGAPPNRALLDQIAALRWVQEEIAAFGGDPARVAVFGQSAGAGAIAALLVMPPAQHLFAWAIAQSVPGTFFTPALSRDISAELLAPLGLAPTAAALADVPPEQLLDPVGAWRWGGLATLGVQPEHSRSNPHVPVDLRKSGQVAAHPRPRARPRWVIRRCGIARR